MYLQELTEALKICNYVFTLIFVLESVFKLVAFGFRRFFKDKSVFDIKKMSSYGDKTDKDNAGITLHYTRRLNLI